MKVAVIGGVVSTEVLIRKLYQHGFDGIHVWGYAPVDTRLVSGWVDLAAVSAELGVDHSPFVKVVDCEEQLRTFQPDLLFAVGLSQLLPPAMLDVAKLENIGFHPTALPRGRGRAAIAWIVLDDCPGAATFFGIREGIDDGPIYVQRPFELTDQDDAASVEVRVLQAEAEGLDEWLPRLAIGNLDPVPQDESAATWYGRRAPDDGWIDWSRSAEELLKLIRASTRPHPGAFTFAGDVRLTIWSVERDRRAEKGVVGRILQVQRDGSFTVQAGDGPIRVTRWTTDRDWHPRSGAKLGHYVEPEIVKLRGRCSELERRLDALEELLRAHEP